MNDASVPTIDAQIRSVVRVIAIVKQPRCETSIPSRAERTASLLSALASSVHHTPLTSLFIKLKLVTLSQIFVFCIKVNRMILETHRHLWPEPSSNPSL